MEDHHHHQQQQQEPSESSSKLEESSNTPSVNPDQTETVFIIHTDSVEALSLSDKTSLGSEATEGGHPYEVNNDIKGNDNESVSIDVDRVLSISLSDSCDNSSCCSSSTHDDHEDSDDDSSINQSDSDCVQMPSSPEEKSSVEQNQFYIALESIYKTTNLSDRAKQAISPAITGDSLTYLYSRAQSYSYPSCITLENGASDYESPYQIKIKGEMLGLTVENVLESTFIRTVAEDGMAAQAGAKVGCVISQIGENKTAHLTHFETIEMLRSSHRPLVLLLEPQSPRYLSSMRDYMAELVAGWKYSAATGLLGSNSDLNARFMSIMSVFLAKIELERGETEELNLIQQILLDHLSRHLTGSSLSSSPSKVTSKNETKNPNVVVRAVKINKIPTKKILKKQIRQTLHRIASNNQPTTSKSIPKKHNFTQVLTQLSPFWDKFGSLSRDIILLLLDSGEENFKVLFQLIAHDLNIPLSDEIIQSDNSSMSMEDKMPIIVPHVDEIREVCVSTYLPLVHDTSQSALSKRKACAVICRLLWSSEGHLKEHPEVRLQIRGVLTRLLHDVESGVRQTTVQTLLYIISTMDHSHLSSNDESLVNASLDPTLGWLVTLAHRLLTDPVPDLRAKSVLLVTDVAEMLPKGATNIESYLLQCKLLPITSRTAEDKSPVVRQSLALHLPRLIAALSPHWVGVLLDVIIALLGDDDHIVKVGVLGSLCDLEPSVLDTILPLITKLKNDEYAGVRCALARTAGQLLVHCHQGDNKDLQRHLDATLLPLVQKLLNDSDSQVTSAALRAVSDATHEFAQNDENATTAKSILSEAHVLKLLPTLRHLTSNPIWRVRSSAVEIVPTLLQCTNKLDVRVEIAQLCISLLGDKVDGVRMMAADALCGGKILESPFEESSQYELADCEWVDLVVLPHMKACAQSDDYRQRLLCFRMIKALLSYPVTFGPFDISPSKPRQVVFELLNSLASDPVPNIRLNIGKVLCSCAGHLSQSELANAICILKDIEENEKLKAKGGDRDVLYYTAKAIQIAQQLSSSIMNHDSIQNPNNDNQKKVNQIDESNIIISGVIGNSDDSKKVIEHPGHSNESQVIENATIFNSDDMSVCAKDVVQDIGTADNDGMNNVNSNCDQEIGVESTPRSYSEKSEQLSTQ